MRWLAWLRPPRTIWPTRDGWWCLAAAVALAFAAMNTANNLLHLCASLLLALVVVSGLLSEQSMRGLRVRATLPDELYAGTAAVVGAEVLNTKRWRASYSVAIEPVGGVRARYLDRLGPGQARRVVWRISAPRRGRHRLPGVRVVTRFPFGLFVKSTRVLLDEPVVVFPALLPVDLARLRATDASDARPSRRRGRGHDLYNLREYRAGDEPRLIHWKSSAKTPSLVVRELEGETSADTRIVLDGRRAPDAARLERALSEAASIAVRLLRAGAGVELAGPGVQVRLGRGRAQARAVLTALALWQPGGGPPQTVTPGLREIRIPLG